MTDKKIKVGAVEVAVLERAPRPEDDFMCSHCLATFKVAELTIVPHFDRQRGWTGAYRCPKDRGAAYEAARSALLFETLSEDELASFVAMIARWNLPAATLRPFVQGETLQGAVLTMINLLERGVVRLTHGFVRPPEGIRPIVLAIDALLACLIAPRGHAIDEALLPLLRRGEARGVLLDFAIESTMKSLLASDTLDVERWAELLTHSDIQQVPDAPKGDPSPEEIAHWRAVVTGEV
jgi:hypothetical protein